MKLQNVTIKKMKANIKISKKDIKRLFPSEAGLAIDYIFDMILAVFTILNKIGIEDSINFEKFYTDEGISYIQEKTPTDKKAIKIIPDDIKEVIQMAKLTLSSDNIYENIDKYLYFLKFKSHKTTRSAIELLNVYMASKIAQYIGENNSDLDNIALELLGTMIKRFPEIKK